MKEKYDREVKAYMAAMRDHGCSPGLVVANGEKKGGEESWEALCRSMACLYVGIEQPGVKKGRIDWGRRVTFGWVAAAVVMRELEVYQEDRVVGPLRKALKKKTGLGD